MKKNVGGDIHIRYKIITKSFRRQTVSRYSLKTNVNQQKKKSLLTKGSIQHFEINFFLCLRLTKEMRFKGSMSADRYDWSCIWKQECITFGVTLSGNGPGPALHLRII